MLSSPHSPSRWTRRNPDAMWPEWYLHIGDMLVEVFPHGKAVDNGQAVDENAPIWNCWMLFLPAGRAELSEASEPLWASKKPGTVKEQKNAVVLAALGWLKIQADLLAQAREEGEPELAAVEPWEPCIVRNCPRPVIYVGPTGTHLCEVHFNDAVAEDSRISVEQIYSDAWSCKIVEKGYTHIAVRRSRMTAILAAMDCAGGKVKNVVRVTDPEMVEVDEALRTLAEVSLDQKVLRALNLQKASTFYELQLAICCPVPATVEKALQRLQSRGQVRGDGRDNWWRLEVSGAEGAEQ